MPPSRKVAVLVGSLRKDSFNRRLAKALTQLAPPALQFDFVDIALPLYNQDLDAAPPREWTAFRERIKPCDAVLFVTPEYNRSVPGVLKNAIDVGSRPYGQSVWAGKPAAVASATVGGQGAFGANHHLRQSLVFLDMPALQQPELYLGHADKVFADDGTVTNDHVRGLLPKFMERFAAWIERNAAAR